MRAALLLLAPTLFALAGCVPPGSTPTDVDGVYLRALGAEQGFDVEIVNGSDSLISVACQGRCTQPSLRYEAQQPSGEWVSLHSNAWWAPESDQHHELPAATAIVATPELWAQELLGPGTYRTLLRFETLEGEASEVGMEFVRVGWSRADALEVEELRARADAVHCRWLVREIDAARVENVEADELIDMHTSESNLEYVIIREMIRRGGFVEHLELTLELASIELVLEIASLDMRMYGNVQQPVREAVARRLVGELDRVEPLDASLFMHIERFNDAWPEHAAARLVVRLADGPEAGTALVNLVDVFTYARHASLTELGPEILSALEHRCSDADGDLAESCASARDRFSDPDAFFATRGIGLSGFGCGWGSEREPCATLFVEWRALRDRLGEIDTIFL